MEIAKAKIKNNILILIPASILIIAFISGCVENENKYKYSKTISGINVYSQIPVSEVENWDDVLLIHKDNDTIIRCNLELSAVSHSNYNGPEISIGKGDRTGIYIHENSAAIKGVNDADITRACHAFVCLKEGLTCPENLSKIKEIINTNHLNIILDNTTSGKSVHGYIELFEAFGHVRVSSIDLYLMDNQKCELMSKLRRVDVVYQSINITGKTVNDCDIDGILILKSDNNEIKVTGKQIILSGDDEHLHSEEMLVFDIIAPELRQLMHQNKN